ncbi:MAG: HAMP domain-containing histidine kinase [bacterium]|nr:HAMP domain-containing histidine kinase [bacterium]
MHKSLQFFKSLFFLLYVFILFYLLLKREYITTLLDIPSIIIPSITFVGFLFIGIRYIHNKLEIHKTEYEFTSVVNHVFRTPITSILWSAKEIEKDITINERLEYLRNINTGANKVLDILEIFAGIKDLNNSVGYKFEATSIRVLIEETLAKYRNEITKKSITFQIPTFKDIPLLTIDLKKIKFVIDAIIENTIFYTKENGKILIDAIADKHKLTIYISDNGMGLDSTEKRRIFSKFYRSHRAVVMNPDGMGLKLYLSKIIIKRHNGKIYAKSKGIEEGTTFILELPFHR